MILVAATAVVLFADYMPSPKWGGSGVEPFDGTLAKSVTLESERAELDVHADRIDVVATHRFTKRTQDLAKVPVGFPEYTIKLAPEVTATACGAEVKGRVESVVSQEPAPWAPGGTRDRITRWMVWDLPFAGKTDCELVLRYSTKRPESLDSSLLSDLERAREDGRAKWFDEKEKARIFSTMQRTPVEYVRNEAKVPLQVTVRIHDGLRAIEPVAKEWARSGEALTATAVAMPALDVGNAGHRSEADVLRDLWKAHPNDVDVGRELVELLLRGDSGKTEGCAIAEKLLLAPDLAWNLASRSLDHYERKCLPPAPTAGSRKVMARAVKLYESELEWLAKQTSPYAENRRGIVKKKIDAAKTYGK